MAIQLRIGFAAMYDYSISNRDFSFAAKLPSRGLEPVYYLLRTALQSRGSSLLNAIDHDVTDFAILPLFALKSLTY